jgi:hypothetical protein
MQALVAANYNDEISNRRFIIEPANPAVRLTETRADYLHAARIIPAMPSPTII